MWWIWQHLEHKSALLIDILTGYETRLNEFVIKQLKCKIVVTDRKLSIVRAPCWRICPILTIQFFIWSPVYMFGLLPNFLLIIIFWKTHYQSAVPVHLSDCNQSWILQTLIVLIKIAVSSYVNMKHISCMCIICFSITI